METKHKKSQPAPIIKTVEEKIAALKNSYFSEAKLDIGATPLPTPYYTFSVGDEIVWGRKSSVFIVEIFDDGKAVIVHNRETDSYVFRYWYEVALKSEVQETNFAKQKFSIVYSTLQLNDVVGQCIKYGINDAISCQRGYVWTLENKIKLIDSIFRGSDIGKFVFVRKDYPHARYVIDGKQRINAIMGFILGEYAYNGVYYRQLSHADKRAFDQHGIQFGELRDGEYSEKDLAQLFLVLNTAGVPQTEEHLNHVRSLIGE